MADKEGTYCLYTTHIPVARSKRPEQCCIVRWNTTDNVGLTRMLNSGSELLSALAVRYTNNDFRSSLLLQLFVWPSSPQYFRLSRIPKKVQQVFFSLYTLYIAQPSALKHQRNLVSHYCFWFLFNRVTFADQANSMKGKYWDLTLDVSRSVVSAGLYCHMMSGFRHPGYIKPTGFIWVNLSKNNKNPHQT